MTAASRSPVGKEPLTRDAIVAAARDMVADEGLEQLSLRPLAARLGVTAPALYAHVSGKRELLAAVAHHAFADLVARYRDVRVEDPVERLRALSGIYVRQALDQPELFHLMFAFRPRAIGIDAELEPLADNELDIATEAFEFPFAAVTEAIATGRFHCDRDPLLTALALWTATHGLATVLLLGVASDDATRADLERAVIDAMLSGLTEPPR